MSDRWFIAPYFFVPDVVAAANYYRDTLAFSYERFWGALHAEFVSNGATMARGLCDQEYGCRDFDVLDCNGYRLCFGQDLG